jgi:tetratricopeptide (TPR) repeat protein
MARWKNFSIILDEYYWHLEDEEWPGPPAPSKAQSIELAVQSVQRFIEATDLHIQGRLEESLILTKHALDLWPLNPTAYVEQCSILFDAGKIDELLGELQRIEQFLFYPILLTELTPIISKVLPPHVAERLQTALATA